MLRMTYDVVVDMEPTHEYICFSMRRACKLVVPHDAGSEDVEFNAEERWKQSVNDYIVLSRSCINRTTTYRGYVQTTKHTYNFTILIQYDQHAFSIFRLLKTRVRKCPHLTRY